MHEVQTVQLAYEAISMCGVLVPSTKYLHYFLCFPFVRSFYNILLFCQIISSNFVITCIMMKRDAVSANY